MEAQGSKFSFQERAAAKSAARAKDEELLRNGQISHAAMARANGGGLARIALQGAFEADSGPDSFLGI